MDDTKIIKTYNRIKKKKKRNIFITTEHSIRYTAFHAETTGERGGGDEIFIDYSSNFIYLFTFIS